MIQTDGDIKGKFHRVRLNIKLLEKALRVKSKATFVGINVNTVMITGQPAPITQVVLNINHNLFRFGSYSDFVDFAMSHQPILFRRF